MQADTEKKTSEGYGFIQRITRHDNFSITCVLAGFVIIVSLLTPNFLTTANILSVLQNMAVTGIVALGMGVVMISGGIDLSIGWLMSLVGSAVAVSMRDWSFSPITALIFGIILGVGLETFMGFLISRTKIEPFIITLGFMSTFQGITYLITGAREILIEKSFEFLGKTRILNIGMPVYIFVFFTVVLWLILKYTRFGRRIYAVGGNAEAAYLAGISVRNFKMIIYSINGALVAIAAMTYTSRIGTGSPLLGIDKEIEAIAAVVVGGTAMSGGKGNMWGVFIGAVLLACISNAMNLIGISPYWQYIIKGLLIVGSVLLSYYGSLRSANVKRS